MESIEIIKIAANAINEKKGREISVIKIGDLTVLADYFVLCSANSSTQVRAICDEVEDKLKESGITPHHIEGKATGWVALDYGSVIIHIFGRNEREFYDLDKMWSDGEILDLDEILINEKEA